jgi:cation diffusion facilitator family transporter
MTHVDAPKLRLARRRNAVIVSLVVGSVMLAMKWAAYLLTDSHAIQSDALESIVNIFATGFALLSILLSERPPDPKYPYGYGKITYVSAGFEGGLITVAAMVIVYEAIQGLIRREPVRNPGWGLILVAIAGVTCLLLGLWLVSKGKRHDSLVLKADGQHILTDSYTSFGVLIGVGLVWATGWSWLDSLVAMVVAMSILATGYHLVRDAMTGLMDRADRALLDRIVQALRDVRRPDWIDVHHLRAWQSGDRTFVDFHLVVPRDWTVVQIHVASDLCLARLKEVLGESTEMLIHFDPDQPELRGFGPMPAWNVSSAVRIPAAGDLGNEDEPIRIG